jgi:hypothetical protein
MHRRIARIGDDHAGGQAYSFGYPPLLRRRWFSIIWIAHISLPPNKWKWW